MSQGEDVFDLPEKDREPFDENGDYDDDWGDWEGSVAEQFEAMDKEEEREDERREVEKEIERLENEGGIGNQKA